MSVTHPTPPETPQGEPRSAPRQSMGPIGPLPPCAAGDAASAYPVPDEAACLELWDRHAMPEHIRRHSWLVAMVSELLARRAEERGQAVSTRAVRASALLHDIAKDYTIRHGGNHAQLGGVWTLEATGNPGIALGVTHHVYWPWDVDSRLWLLPVIVLYGDKRVRHDELVTIDDRFEDLFRRYGRNDYIRGRIEESRLQALRIEPELNIILELDLNACTFNSGRLV